MKRSLEERERWEAEKESWARVAQALIAQGRREAAHWEARDSIAAHYGMVTADAATHRIQEYERVNSAQQNEKKMLQQKVGLILHIYLVISLMIVLIAQRYPISTGYFGI